MTTSSINTQKTALHSIKTKPKEETTRLSSRRMSREFPLAVDTSFDVYYRESSVGVPFLWESQPGTPKVKYREFSLPPLTPPPSFHGSPISRKPLKSQPRNNLVTSVLLPKLNLKKISTQFEQTPSRSTSSSLSSPWSTGSSPLSQRRVSSPSRMSFDSRIEEDDQCESPVSTLCCRGGRSSGGRSQGCSSTIIKLFLGELS